MSEYKHTPKPWCADVMGNVWGQAPGRHGKIANLSSRPQAAGYDVIPMSEVRANAHLIAAAPELLEALENPISPFDWESADMFHKRLLEFNAAVIAKAIGATP